MMMVHNLILSILQLLLVLIIIDKCPFINIYGKPALLW